MSIYLEAAEALDRELARVQSLVQASAALRAVGSLDQVAREAEARVGKAEQALAATEALVTERQLAADKARDELDAARDVMKQERDASDAIKRRAEADAEARLANAVVAADRIVTEAKARAEAEAAAIAQRPLDEVARLEAANAAAREQLRVTTDEVTSAQAHLDAINADVAALRAKF